jgi:hypothetical protein
MRSLHALWVFACLTIYVSPAAFAADYWIYSYKGIEVTTSGRAQSAKTIAHNLHRLDGAITRVMGVQASDWRTPTQVYLLPTAMFTRVRGVKDGSDSAFMSTPFENTILINGPAYDSENGLWNAYYGYTGGVLVSAYSFRYPGWFIVGLSELFAASTINGTTVTIGAANASRARTLVEGNLIPVKTLMAIRARDPQLKNADYATLYSAESWFLVHLILLEGKYHSNFFKCFQLLDQGDDEAKAFAASFEVSYEDLDKMLRDAVQARKIETIRVTLADEKDDVAPVHLTDAQAAGRLAGLAAGKNTPLDDAFQMANEAIALDPKNQDALGALARIQIRRTDYAAAFQSGDRLCSQDPLTQKSLAQCGFLFHRFAAAVQEKKADLGVEAGPLAERSRQYYDKAIKSDGEDLVSWDGMADLLSFMKNADYTRAFLPSAEQTLSAHIRISDLARALAGLCASVGDTRSALNYAVMWQSSALDPARRDAAAAYVSRLQAALERGDLQRAPGTH